jgi:urea transport system ATP-binding protein
MSGSTSILEVRDLHVSFDGFTVLDHLSMSVGVGELRFLIGPNGAGKTTLMDAISGKTKPDSGTVLFAGAHELTRLREDDIVRLGVGRKFQTPSVFGSLTCFENVEVAAGFRSSLAALLRRRGSQRTAQVMWALERVGLTERADISASVLAHGERQWLEIAMLLVQDPKLLLLDEPVAGLTGEERERTGELLHALEGAHSLIVTEHDMDFVRQFARTVTVLHLGAVLREGSVDDIQQDVAVQDVYLGRARQPVRAGAAGAAS